MQTFLFTGASGYIGSHSAFWFLRNRDECKIVIYDNLSTGFAQNYEYLQSVFPNRVEFVKGDLSESAKLDSLFSKHNFSAVVHFAASLIVSESVSLPLVYYKNNTLNTTLLIELCIKYGIQKFIFSSTAAVYGEPDSKLIPIIESAPLAPINPYGASKMMSERVLMDTHIANPNFNYAILRYFNVAGASSANTQELLDSSRGLGQRSKNATHLIKVACECASGKREGMSIFGKNYKTPDGTCVRDYIHIDDLASAHLCALKFLESTKQSEVFNVGYGRGYSVSEVVEMVKKVSGVDFKVIDSAPRTGDPAILVADNFKIKHLTSWKPQFDDLAFIIKSAYEWEKAF
ncbi:UDP-glucose 4-epimerase GalE [Helicobacter himalayensis]|uniref:UDP-glucose 4-epimerase GalE n=1 Tax=Helicobacter himalayensis TaxID=1591088 RepID=UPI000832380B|nr:UDP-glucose 4-epimerase GalE [Helicobacter himalayensis]